MLKTIVLLLLVASVYTRSIGTRSMMRDDVVVPEPAVIIRNVAFDDSPDGYNFADDNCPDGFLMDFTGICREVW
ncbi:hypothetical protein RR48_10827 [Papilio machaon]|uniref:Chitin-binding type-2 domain-containing protein n=1 Tax=Papilio machaon TaxID=76193 RepID=A0A194R746_PAPMA|nr:hypothetical protein RR48_10827 [Papilio machaon]